jgi:hypothetical protein
MGYTSDGYGAIGRKARHIAVVYVIAPDENGPSKIGFTTDIGRRLVALQVGCWLPLQVHDIRLSIPKFEAQQTFNILQQAEVGARMAESAAHVALTECDLRLTGEWFDVTPKEAMQVIDKAGQGAKYRVVSVEHLASAFTSVSLDPYNARIHKALLKGLVDAKRMATEISEGRLNVDTFWDG